MNNSGGQFFRVSWAKTVIAFIALILGISMVIGAWRIASGPREQKKQRETLFQLEIVPVLDQEQERNRLAIDRAKQHLAVIFSAYSARVPKFVDELMSWSRKCEITKAVLRDKFHGSTETRQYVVELFGQHVMSDSGLQQDLNNVIGQFHGDLEANRNWMLSQVSLRLKTSHAPVPDALIDLDSLRTGYTWINTR